MKTIITLLVAVLLVPSLSACRSEEDEQKVQALVKRTLENLVFVEGGSFMMGDAGVTYTNEYGREVFRYWTGEKDTKPAHKVTLDSYSILKYEVTYEDFDLFSNITGRALIDKDALGDPDRTSEKPVWGVPWQPAKDYCKWLAKETGLPFDLPTEAQWEYAARSRGLNVAFATDNGKIDFDRNYGGKKATWYPSPPGSYPPNPLGVYDMTGNVHEWVNDWYDQEYYANSPVKNPQGPEEGHEKIMRGFGVVGSTEYKALYRRDEEPPTSTDEGGIRCVVNNPLPIRAN